MGLHELRIIELQHVAKLTESHNFVSTPFTIEHHREGRIY